MEVGEKEPKRPKSRQSKVPINKKTFFPPHTVALIHFQSKVCVKRVLHLGEQQESGTKVFFKKGTMNL